MAFEGSCHCGAVTFTVEGDPPGQAVRCNCSHCQRKGFLLAFYPASAVRLKSGEEALRTYRFNTHRLAHRFCETCGVQPFAEGSAPDGSATRAVNLLCVPTLDLATLQIQDFDGAAV